MPASKRGSMPRPIRGTITGGPPACTSMLVKPARPPQTQQAQLHEAKADGTDQQAQAVIGEPLAHPSGQHHAEQRRGQQQPQLVPIKATSETEQSQGIEHQQQRQQDRRRPERRQQQAHHRHADGAERSTGSPLGKPVDQPSEPDHQNLCRAEGHHRVGIDSSSGGNVGVYADAFPWLSIHICWIR